jgi:AAA15 family ATPase/GTPase
MLINFSIQNFGSIKNRQTLSFEADKFKHLENYYVINANGLRLLKIGLIFGANASGKTTILKALDFLRNIVLMPFADKNEIFKFEPFLFDDNTSKQNTVFNIDFIYNNLRYEYEVELNKHSIVRELLCKYTPRKSKVYERTTDVEKQLTHIFWNVKIKIDDVFSKTLIANTLWNNTVLGGFLKTNIELKELADVTNWFKVYLYPIIYTRTNLNTFVTTQINKCKINKDVILDIIRNADFNISNIIKKEERIDDSVSTDLKFEHTVGNKSVLLPFESESQGTLRYYELGGILYLLVNKSALFLIDELESSLHPDLFQHFLLSFLVNSKKSQIIATTHNREILNNKDIFRNDAIWITDKDNEHYATELYSLAYFDTKVIHEATNVFNAYKLGKLGGVPNLGDYFIDIDDEKK